MDQFGARVGAGEGNRTLVVSLGSFCSAIELHPQNYSMNILIELREGRPDSLQRIGRSPAGKCAGTYPKPPAHCRKLGKLLLCH